MRTSLAVTLLILFTSAFASSGTNFLLNRYGGDILEICDFEYRDYALSVTELDVRQPYCIFSEQSYDEVYNDLSNVVLEQLGKVFKYSKHGARTTMLEDGTRLDIEVYANMDNTEGEVHLFSRGQGTYMVILESY